MSKTMTDMQRQMKRARDQRYRERNKERVAKSNHDAREKRKANGKDAAYLALSRDRRVALKEKYRREAGAVPREVLATKAAERIATQESRRAAKADFISRFIGPPKPKQAMSAAEYYQWRVTNDPDFYAKELDRAQRYKVRTRPGYKPAVIAWSAMPQVVKEVKHITYRIAREINRREANEDHQRAA